MSEPRLCPQCGAPLPVDAPQGVCPKCVLDLGMAAAGPSEPGGASQAAASAAQPAGSRLAGGLGETTPHSGAASGFVPPTPAELAPSFPQLEILELLGQGGMGAVYKARQPRLDRIVALKILPPQAGADPSFAERFAREARALARLSHPNIVTMHDFGDVGGMYYFVMEYVDGANLRQLIYSRSLAPEKALAIVPQICEALQYAHDEGVVHRDIKPENVLVDRRGRVKIADFGLAKLLGNSPDITLTRTQQVMGTPHYMAPEQIEHPLEVDHRADIYSLGVVFYEMLTGELPIGRFEPPSEKVAVDVRLDDVVLRALQKQPERRYQHASELKTDVDSIASTPGAPKTPVPPLSGSGPRQNATSAFVEPANGGRSSAPSAAARISAADMLAIIACLIGGLATVMPWSSQHMFVMDATASGFDTWHGLVTGGIFAAALVAIIVLCARSASLLGRVLASTVAGASGVVIGAVYLASQPATFDVTSQQMPSNDLFKPLTESLSPFLGSMNNGIHEGKLIGPYVVLVTGVVLLAIAIWQAVRFLIAPRAEA